MSSGMRRRLRFFWPHGHPYGHYHGFCPFAHGHYGPPPWWMEKPAVEDEKEDLKEYLKTLKEEIEEVEKHMKELEKAGETK